MSGGISGGMCINTHVDMSTNMHTDECIELFVAMRINVRKAAGICMRVDMCNCMEIDMYIDMCINMCTFMYICMGIGGMGIDLYPSVWTWVWTWVSAWVYGYGHKHV